MVHPDALIAHDRIAESKKTEEFFLALIDHYVPDTGYERLAYERLRALYRLVNNDMEGIQEHLRHYCDPTIDRDAFDMNKEQFQVFNEIHSKIQVLKGELLKKNPKFVVTLTSEIDRETKAEELTARLTKAMERAEGDIQSAVEAPEQQAPGMVQDSKARLTQEVEDIKSMPSSWELINQRFLRQAYRKENVIDKMGLSLHHQLVSGIVALRNDFVDGEPTIEVVNCLHLGFSKAANETRLERSDAIWETDSISVREALLMYRDELNEDQIDELTGNLRGTARGDYAQSTLDVIGGRGELTRRNPLNRRSRIGGDRREHEYYQGQAQVESASGRDLDEHDYITRTRLEVKLLKKVRLLKMVYADGIVDFEIGNPDLKIPRRAKKSITKSHLGRRKIKTYDWEEGKGADLVRYRVYEHWIPRRYKATRLGADMLVSWGECPNQPDFVDNPYRDFTLSVKGRFDPCVNADMMSAIARTVPYYVQYTIVKNLETRELSKYIGSIVRIDWATVPTFMREFEEVDNGDGTTTTSEVSSGNELGSVLKTLRVLGLDIYDSNELEDKNSRHTATGNKVMSTNQANEIVALHQLSKMLAEEIGMSMGITQQREGMMVAETAQDNERAQNASYYMTEPILFVNSTAWREATEEHVGSMGRVMRRYFEENPGERSVTLSFLTERGDEEIFRVMPDDFGVFPCALHLAEEKDQDLYRKVMLQNAQAFSQNQGEGILEVSKTIQLITSGASAPEIHVGLERMSKDLQRKRAEMQKAQAASEMQAEKDKMAAVEKAEAQRHLNARDLALIASGSREKSSESQADGARDVALINNEGKLRLVQAGASDEDGINDQIESIRAAEQVQHERDRENRAERIETRNALTAQANLKLAEKKLQIAEQTAKQKAAAPNK